MSNFDYLFELIDPDGDASFTVRRFLDGEQEPSEIDLDFSIGPQDGFRDHSKMYRVTLDRESVAELHAALGEYLSEAKPDA